MRQADAACYLAKERGRNRVEMYDSRNDLLEQRDHMQSWYSRINQALDQSLFSLFSQQLEPISLQVNGEKAREILIRLQGESGEIVLPGAFIPAADYYHLTPRIDRWVIEEVVRHFLSLDEPDGCTYFVNLSGLTLSDPEYIKATSKLLPPYVEQGLRVCFEITESEAIRHLDSARQFIDRFKTIGCLLRWTTLGAASRRSATSRPCPWTSSRSTASSCATS